MLAEDIGHCIRLFLVGGESHDRLGIVRNLDILPHAWINRCGDGAENLLDLSLNLIDIYVTYDNNSLLIRTIPLFIIVTKHLVWEVVDNLHSTDRKSVAVTVAVRIQSRKNLLVHPHLGVHSCTPLLVDHSPLVVDVLVGEQKAVSPVVEYPQTAVNRAWNGSDRDIVDVVNSLVNRSVGIEISAELHTDRLAVLDDPVSREVLSTVEAHMLKEVGKTPLTVVLEDGTHLLGDIEVSLACRLRIVTDIVGKAIVKLSDLYCRIDRNRRHLLLG